MTTSQRIVSFLPSATEIACALGLEDALLGITHECDYPPEVKTKPVVVRNVLPIEKMSQSEIDRAVAERMRAGLSLYQIDEQLLHELAPDLILTQDLCQVCAPSGNEVSQVLKSLPKTPQVLWMTPRNVGEIFDNVRDLGAATGRTKEAEKLVDDCKARIEALSRKTAAAASRPRVFCMEWTDPIYCCGHWVPEMVRIAGGRDDMGRDGTDSVRIAWENVLDYRPEVLIVMPCGYGLQKSAELARSLFDRPGYADAQAIAHRISDLYVAEEVDRVVIVYNHFVSPLVQQVVEQDVLPIPEQMLEAGEDEEHHAALLGDFIYEPEPEQILERLLPVYVETELYRALLESAASEQGARMTAMRNASKNAGELIDSLTLAMNRARQAEITQEILEVVAGADALTA